MTQLTRINSQASKVIPNPPQTRTLSSNRTPLPSKSLIESVDKKQLSNVANSISKELCILSNVPKDADLTAGHAWLKVSTDNKSTTYGLWPDNHPSTIDNGDNSDVRIGKEDDLPSKASYCRTLSNE